MTTMPMIYATGMMDSFPSYLAAAIQTPYSITVLLLGLIVYFVSYNVTQSKGKGIPIINAHETLDFTNALIAGYKKVKDT